jgi:hypothetical protein
MLAAMRPLAHGVTIESKECGSLQRVSSVGASARGGASSLRRRFWSFLSCVTIAWRRSPSPCSSVHAATDGRTQRARRAACSQRDAVRRQGAQNLNSRVNSATDKAIVRHSALRRLPGHDARRGGQRGAGVRGERAGAGAWRAWGWEAARCARVKCRAAARVARLCAASGCWLLHGGADAPPAPSRRRVAR